MGLEKVQELHLELTECLSGVRMDVAGRIIYYDAEQRMFILAMHSTSPEATQKAASLAWDAIPDSLKAKLSEQGIGFAGKQI